MQPTIDIPKPQVPAPLPPVLQPQGAKPKQRSMAPTFLGGGATPTTPQNSAGGKTLLGQ